MTSFILDFLSTWRRLLSCKAFAFQSLGGFAWENNVLFIVNFSRFFHQLSSRQAFLLGWLLSLLSSGLSLGLIGLNWLCSLFYFTCAPVTPSIGLGGGNSFCSWQSSPYEDVVRCSYLLMTKLNLFYLFSYPQSTFTSVQ